MKNIGVKILRVMEEVKSVVKDGTNSFHKYKYASDAAIVTTIRKSLIKNKLVCLPRQMSCVVSGEMTTLEIEYSLVDVESGEIFIGRVYGQGQDKGDKGVYKAATGAEKYFLLKTFLLPTDDDPENEKKGKNYSKPQDADEIPIEEYSTGVRVPAGYWDLDEKGRQERLGKGFYPKKTEKGWFIFSKEAPGDMAPVAPGLFISIDEQKEVIAQLKNKRIDKEAYLAYLKTFECSGTKEIPKERYSSVISWIIQNEPDALNG